MTKTYITFEVEHDGGEDPADVAEDIIFAVDQFYDGSGQYKVQIQSISDTPPHSLREF